MCRRVRYSPTKVSRDSRTRSSSVICDTVSEQVIVRYIAGTLAVSGYPVWIAWLVPVVVGIVINTALGTHIAYMRIPSIVATLGMLSILKGGLISLTGGTCRLPIPHETVVCRREHRPGEAVVGGIDVGIDRHPPLRHELERPSPMRGGDKLNRLP